MQNSILQTLNLSVLVGGEGQVAPETTQALVQTEAPESTNTATFGSGTGGFTLMMVYVLIMVAVFYFTAKPARKREQQIKDLQNQLKIGDNVVTTSGMHGKIVDVNDETFNIEFGSNKSVIIPISKKDVLPSGIDLTAKNITAPEQTKA